MLRFSRGHVAETLIEEMFHAVGVRHLFDTHGDSQALRHLFQLPGQQAIRSNSPLNSARRLTETRKVPLQKLGQFFQRQCFAVHYQECRKRLYVIQRRKLDNPCFSRFQSMTFQPFRLFRAAEGDACIMHFLLFQKLFA
jgi:hypothetical protein